MVNETAMSVTEKLALLNTLPILEWEIFGEFGGCVTVAVNDKTRAVFHKLGYDDQYIEKEQTKISDTKAEIDIYYVAAEIGANWFKPAVGFLVVPDEIGQEG